MDSTDLTDFQLDALHRQIGRHARYLRRLKDRMPPPVHKWESKLKVHIVAYFLQRMEPKWGACNHLASHIRVKTELVKKPRDLLEYVVVHEMAHLLEPTHSDRFISLLDSYYPTSREARAELNELPLTAGVWQEWPLLPRARG